MKSLRRLSGLLALLAINWMLIGKADAQMPCDATCVDVDIGPGCVRIELGGGGTGEACMDQIDPLFCGGDECG